MGFHFALLLAHCQSLKSTTALMCGSILAEMVRLSTSIINLAIDTTDERTRHLTDHIYHIITFAAITLCRLVNAYEPKLRAAKHDIHALDELIWRLVSWLKSIGLPCHVAHMLGNIVSMQHEKLRPGARPQASVSPYDAMSRPGHQRGLPSDGSFLYPEFTGAELFDLDSDPTLWPDWDQIISDGELSVLGTM